jgi:flagellar protein FlgJ
MSVETFVSKILPLAQTIEGKYKVPALSAMAQSALETGYGASAPGNLYFGLKPGSSWTGKKQLLRTKEYHNNPNVKYPVVISVTKINDSKYLYDVKDYFRAYNTPLESFEDYAKLLKNNTRYKNAFNYTDPYLFSKEIAKAGFATDPDYYNKVSNIITLLKKKALSLGFQV